MEEREYELEKKKAEDVFQRNLKLNEMESRERVEMARIDADKARAKADEAREEANGKRDKMIEALMMVMQSQMTGGGGPAK